MISLTGKTVAVVGNADTVNAAQIIDGCDVVVRCNFGFTTCNYYPERVGKRTDLTYHFVNFQHYYPEVKIPGEKKMIDYRLRNKFTKKLGGVPTTGIITLLEVCKQLPKSVYITGISFYQRPYITGLMGQDSDWHQPAVDDIVNGKNAHSARVDYQLFKAIYRKYKDILILDEFLTKIVQSWQQKNL